MGNGTIGKTPATIKVKVALAALAGGKTLAELAQQVEVHSNQITDWKRQLSAQAADVFGKSSTNDPPPVDVKSMHTKIGQLILVNDFSENALTEAGVVIAESGGTMFSLNDYGEIREA